MNEPVVKCVKCVPVNAQRWYNMIYCQEVIMGHGNVYKMVYDFKVDYKKKYQNPHRV